MNEAQRAAEFMRQAEARNWQVWTRLQDEPDERRKRALLEIAEHTDAIANQAIADYRAAVSRLRAYRHA